MSGCCTCVALWYVAARVRASVVAAVRGMPPVVVVNDGGAAVSGVVEACGDVGMLFAGC
jgi:hypothetical protein